MNSPTQVTIGRPAPKEIVFERVVNDPPSRLILSVDGLPNDGKTHFCCTAPGPICFHDLDFGLSGVAEGFAEKELYKFAYQIPVTARLPGSGFTNVADAAAKVWEEYVAQFRASLLRMRTVVVDTGSEAWNLCRLARLGKLVQVLPVQYTAVNAEFRQLVQLALGQKTCNVIFTHKLKDEYKDDKKTGKFERQGFGEIGYDVESVLRCTRDTTKQGVEQFAVEIEKCRANLNATGKRFAGADCTFPKVACAIYDGTAEDFWTK